MFSIVPYHIKLLAQVLADNSGAHFLADVTIHPNISSLSSHNDDLKILCSLLTIKGDNYVFLKAVYHRKTLSLLIYTFLDTI